MFGICNKCPYHLLLWLNRYMLKIERKKNRFTIKGAHAVISVVFHWYFFPAVWVLFCYSELWGVPFLEGMTNTSLIFSLYLFTHPPPAKCRYLFDLFCRIYRESPKTLWHDPLIIFGPNDMFGPGVLFTLSPHEELCILGSNISTHHLLQWVFAETLEHSRWSCSFHPS